MKSIWVVTFSDYSEAYGDITENRLVGVFTTKERALDYANKSVKSSNVEGLSVIVGADTYYDAVRYYLVTETRLDVTFEQQEAENEERFQREMLRLVRNAEEGSFE